MKKQPVIESIQEGATTSIALIESHIDQAACAVFHIHGCVIIDPKTGQPLDAVFGGSINHEEGLVGLFKLMTHLLEQAEKDGALQEAPNIVKH